MKNAAKFSVFGFICFIMLLNPIESLAQKKAKKTDNPHNKYTAIYPVKFFCKAVGDERDVIIMEANDPRFLQLRVLLGTIFKPYPKPERWVDEEMELYSFNRIKYENDSVPLRRLESWYFIKGSFLKANYEFVASDGEPQVSAALALNDSIWNDPINQDAPAVMWACANNYAALQVYLGNLSQVETFLKPYLSTYSVAVDPLNWLYRAVSTYQYYSNPDEKTETVNCMKATGKTTQVGTLSIAPKAYIQQPFLSYKWGVFEIPPVKTSMNIVDMLVGKFNDGYNHVLWTGVRCEPVLEYLFAKDMITVGATSYLKNNNLAGVSILSLSIENTGEVSVPWEKVSFSLMIDDQILETKGHLYSGSEQKTEVGSNNLTSVLKPGFPYQLHISGPSTENLKKVSSFVLRIMDMPQQLTADGMVAKRGFIDITFAVDNIKEPIKVKYFPMQSPMVCKANYTSTPMVNIPAMNNPVVTKRKQIVPKIL